MQRTCIALTCALFLANSAFAQQAATPVAQPIATITKPTAPTPPTVTAPTLAPTNAASAATSNPMQDMLQQQLQKLSSNKNTGQSVGMLLVMGQLLGCTQKTAGKEATQAFYNEMTGIGKTVEGYCKQGNAAEARALVLATITAKKDDAVMKAMLNCYDMQAPNLAGFAGQQLAADAQHYANWARNPASADREMKEGDVCRNKVATPAAK